MKISFGKKVISPEIGTKVAGYGTEDYSVAKLDDLYVTALALDDGSKRSVILGFDLLGIDEEYIKKIRKACADVFGGEEAQVIVSCTHTHSGPNVRTLGRCPSIFEKDYADALVVSVASLVKGIFEQDWIETDVFFYSLNCDANVNRRFVASNNKCSFLPHRRDMERIADGFADKEVGVLAFRDKKNRIVYIIGNYAAHPLASHCPGIGGHRISADYPGAFRRYIEEETGADCMFLSGAAGDMVPKGHETGKAASEAVGIKLAQAAINGVITATRDSENYMLKNTTLQYGQFYTTAKMREFRKYSIAPQYAGKDELKFELQLLSIGDVCLVGVPGEMVAELGQEIKWHSPFRKTFILYCSTAYMDYLCHGNALVAGGYEAREQYTDGRTGLKLVTTAVDGAYELYERTFPNKNEWPENNSPKLVNLINI